MVTDEIDSKILLAKFDLEPEEMAAARKLAEKYAERIGHLTEYDEIKLEMKVHRKDKNKHFEIRGLVVYKGDKAYSEVSDMNPLKAIDAVLNKLLNEIKHKTEND
jgi:ribosome-associated translation inhibitor RaiA